MKFHALICARAGSRGIKNKNIKKFKGKPLIAHPIQLARKIKKFKSISVSTDSKKIANISKYYGADVPFIRSKKLSNDKTGTMEVLIDAIKKTNSVNEKFCCLFYPTSPLIKAKDLNKAFNILKSKKNADGIFTIAEYNSHPMRSLILKNNFVNFKFSSYKKKNSNDLKKMYFDCGNFYFYRTKKILKKNINLKMLGFKIESIRSIDINTHDDIKLAKIIYKNNNY